MIHYYLFLQKIQFSIVARFLLIIAPMSLFTNSEYFLYHSNLLPNFIPNYISFILSFFIIFVLYIYSVIYVFRDISFKDYAIYRTGKISVLSHVLASNLKNYNSQISGVMKP